MLNRLINEFGLLSLPVKSTIFRGENKRVLRSCLNKFIVSYQGSNLSSHTCEMRVQISDCEVRFQSPAFFLRVKILGRIIHISNDWSYTVLSLTTRGHCRAFLSFAECIVCLKRKFTLDTCTKGMYFELMSSTCANIDDVYRVHWVFWKSVISYYLTSVHCCEKMVVVWTKTEKTKYSAIWRCSF